MNRGRPLSNDADLNLPHVYVEMANASRLSFTNDTDLAIRGGFRPVAVASSSGYIDLGIPTSNDFQI